MKIVEYFLSIQGEGKFSGKNAFFIRTFGCNLSCKGFGVEKISPKTSKILVGCDTLRAVKSDFPSINADFRKIKKEIMSLKFKPLIVITGGEPLLWYKNEDLNKFIKWALKNKFIIQFETNGTIEIDFERFKLYKKCFFAVSPKLKFANQANSINKKALKSLFKNAKCFYKFVIKDESDINEIKQILSIQNGEVWCMPLGKNKFELEKNANLVANLCIKNGFNYSDRLQIRLWDDKEGV